MFSYEEFTNILAKSVPDRFGKHWLNKEQDEAVRAPMDRPVFIVAGPGTGKTTVLVLRILKHIFVDGVPPEGIIATTFTRKAAAELRSRLLSWGYAAITHLNEHPEKYKAKLKKIADIDINAVLTDTLDAIAGQFLINYREAGQIVPETIEPFLANGILRNRVVFPEGLHGNSNLDNLLKTLIPGISGKQILRFPRKMSAIMEFIDRVRHDMVNIDDFKSQSKAHELLCLAFEKYEEYLAENSFADFTSIEKMFLRGLKKNKFPIGDQYKVLLVDEFQDTNHLQEQIYFQLCKNGVSSLTVVGDDDQSIYRFRGATVEIFANFDKRVAKYLGKDKEPFRIDLSQNYRSTPYIVQICNEYIKHDTSFQQVRVPNKKDIVSSTAVSGNAKPLPVLAMFRGSQDELAIDLCDLLTDIFRGQGRTIQCSDTSFVIKGSTHGDLGDSVLLCRSAREQKEDGTAKLPLLLRQNLKLRDIDTFNPRGRSLGQIDDVQRLLGLILLTIDLPGNILQSITTMPAAIQNRILQWRSVAADYIKTNPMPAGLPEFVEKWKSEAKKSHNNELPLIDLVYYLIRWFPYFQSSPEGQIYIEAITRTIMEASSLSSFKSHILIGKSDDLEAKSIRSIIREIFEPIASEEVDVDESIMPIIPRSYFPIMTIHQAKGLEFPLVIVDVGSEFKTNHHTQKPFRAPEDGASVHKFEDAIAAYSPIGDLRKTRTQQERAWDDLRRQHYVAYSRPQDVLLLVGLFPLIRTPLHSVALGDDVSKNRCFDFVSAEDWTTSMSRNTVVLI